MTECSSAEMRELLPDLAANTLDVAERERAEVHVASCLACAHEFALVRAARALPYRTVAIDVAKITAMLPRPTATGGAAVEREALSLHAPTSVGRARATTPLLRASRAWRMAATLGVIVAGGWSIMLVRSGGLSLMGVGRADSTHIAQAVIGFDSSVATRVGGAAVESLTSHVPSERASRADARGSAVSFGDLGDYSDEELQGVLDRLDRWDGSTSTELSTTIPILPVNRGGTEE